MSDFSKSEKEKRFDESFKWFLVIVNLALSTGLSFYKEQMDSELFWTQLGLISIIVGMWVTMNLYAGKSEYFGKILTWWLMLIGYPLFYSRLIFATWDLPPPIFAVCLTIAFVATAPIVVSLKDSLAENEKGTLKLIILITVLGVLMDILRLVFVIIKS